MSLTDAFFVALAVHDNTVVFNTTIFFFSLLKEGSDRYPWMMVSKVQNLSKSRKS